MVFNMKNKLKMEIRDIDAKKMDDELIIMSNKDRLIDEFDPDYEIDNVEKRVSKGSSVVTLSSSKWPAKIKPIYLTKIGHGAYDPDTMSMLGFCDCETDELIEKFKDALIRYPSIKQINLFGCKSALTPQSLDKQAFANRVRSPETIKFSYCEEFLIQLIHAFERDQLKFPKNLSVIGALGDITMSNGKVGVSKHKRTIFHDDYVTISPVSGLIRIDADKFLNAYNSIPIVDKIRFKGSSIGFFSNDLSSYNLDSKLESKPNVEFYKK